MRRHVRRRIFISEHDNERIRKETKLSRSTVQRFAAGFVMTRTNETLIREAMAKLKIGGPERHVGPSMAKLKIGAPVAPEPEAEAAPLSA